MANKYLTAEERFWPRVDKRGPDECWNWSGASAGFGYGVLSVNGRQIGAHVYALRRTGIEVPKGSMVCHKCDNPRCVNPRHLYVGTARQNMRDMRQRGRQRDGLAVNEANGMTKLTVEDVADVLRMHAAGFLGTEIARKHGVAKSTIYDILNGRSRHAAVRAVAGES